nr:hypothetical protein [Tanacetum cinerariifolium]
VTTTETYMETYKNVSQDIRDQLNAEAEVVQIILTGIDNDIYSTVDACPNACEMWKAIERGAGYDNPRLCHVAGARETVDEHNVVIDSLDMSYDREQIDQNDDDDDLANERELLASLIEKLKVEN